jgi:Na+-translocating ferredoxin:NAD+ oxidoreductase RnfD subunit
MTGIRDILRKADPKHFQTFLITLLLVVGEARYSVLGGYDRLVVALGACLLTEAALSLYLRDRWPSLMSAYVSGISMALLTKPQGGALWPFAVGGFLAIASKYVLTFRGRHIWNPTNFAISMLLLLAASRVSILSHQWGNEVWTNALIWGVGLVVVSRARVLHITLMYVACFLLFAALRSGLEGLPLLPEVAPLTGPMYQLFAFFMVTDPRTTVRSRQGRLVVVFVIALVEALIRAAADHHLAMPAALEASPPILALFLVGPVAMWLDLRRGAPAPAPAVQPAAA